MSHLLFHRRVCESGKCCAVLEKYAKLKVNIFCWMPVIKFLVILELIWTNRDMSHMQGQELQTSYMDGITVKISEHYKPPPRISLPITYAQRLSLNKQLQDNMPTYSFLVERKAKEQLESLKKIRNDAAENRKLRSERIKEEMKEREDRRKEATVKECEVTEESTNKRTGISDPLFVTQDSSQNNHSNGILQPVQACNILTPIPLSSITSKANNSPVDRSPFNISDFEADTSSPFDNMELKTLNDMEELAQVLRNETPKTSSTPSYPTYSSVQTLPSHSYSAVNYNSYLSSEGRSGITQQTNSYIPNYPQAVIYNGTSDYYPASETPATQVLNAPYSYTNQNTRVYNPNAIESYPGGSNTNTFRTVPHMLRTLETKLENHHINNVQYSNLKTSNMVSENKKASVPVSIKIKEELDNPFSSLPKNLQDLAVMISTMGFPLPRVARACQLLGDDHKKASIKFEFYIFFTLFQRF